MALKLAFLTGARSEYGLAKALLRALQADKRFKLEIIPNGMHLLNKYGSTVNEIYADCFDVGEIVNTYSEEGEAKVVEFCRTVKLMKAALDRRRPDVVLVIGDRIEAYAAALAAHFSSIPIVHSGGGHITLGAVDNIYRYNISNLASLHFATSQGAYKMLCSCPNIDSSSVHFIGSVAVDEIMSFKSRPKSISKYVTALKARQFALMTFHSTTAKDEPIPSVMQTAINVILRRGISILLTYPNNDTGSDQILDVIEANRTRSGVFIMASLGAYGYYAALNDCLFVIGNSSSALSEAPYFNIQVINVGSRQEGREMDIGVINVDAKPDAIKSALEKGFSNGWSSVPCNYLYGRGNSSSKACDLIASFFKKGMHDE